MGKFCKRGGVIFGLSCWLVSITSLAANCDLCQKEFAELQKQNAEREKTVQLLGKNKEYLAALSASEASKILKVKSNVVVILKKLDAIKAETEKTQNRMKEMKCDECSAGVPDPTPSSNDLLPNKEKIGS